MLTDRLAPNFDSQVRARGERYAASGRVVQLSIQAELVQAVVRGSQDYQVQIKRLLEGAGWILEVGCTCPYADSSDPFCKHVWATFVVAEQRLEQAWGAPPRKLTLDEAPFEGDDEPYDLEPRASLPRPRPESPDAATPGNPLDPRFRFGSYSSEKGFRQAVEKVFQEAGIVPLSRLASPTPSTPPKKPKVPPWKRMLDETRSHVWGHSTAATGAPSPIAGTLWYVIDQEKSRFNRTAVVEIMRSADGAPVPGESTLATPPRKLARLPITAEDVARIENPDDRWICALLLGAARPTRESFAYSDHRSASEQRAAHWQLNPQMLGVAMPRLAATNRLLSRKTQDHAPEPVLWAPDSPWELGLDLIPQSTDPSTRAMLWPVLRRGTERVGLGDIAFTVDGNPGIAMDNGQIAPLHIVGGRSGGMLSWARDVASRNPTLVDQAEVAALLDALAAKHISLPMMWPDGWGPRRLAGVLPRPRLHLTTPLADKYRGPADFLRASIGFEYEGVRVEAGTTGFVAVSFPDGSAAVVERHTQAERDATDRFVALGGKQDNYRSEYHVPIKRVPTVAAGLLSDGWEVVRDAAKYRAPGAVNIRVTSGIDWFDLEGAAQFGEISASIGAVLEALRKGERFVSLGDGSLGLLPDEWLSKHGRWLGLGRAEGENIRFAKAQLSLIDALMAELPEATCDKQVAAARQKLRKFDGIEARKEPKSFKGELRPYQRQGLGWLTFLAEFGLGGCLADDMGLGKTVQLLAHLADRRKQGEKQPWLVVAPKSLVLNWAKESQRFTPGLKVIDYTGIEREAVRESLASGDLVLTTYATMRMDIELLREIEFGCVVLDEAQTIKNATSQAAKAARLLKASRRLALTGTPVENRLEDVWSIFEFLNPGMLGSMPAFQQAAKSGKDADGMVMLRRALRPFLLRRTKATVAPELPARSEQTVRCELEGKQRKLYDDLRTHYQTQLLGRVERDGMNKSKMHVLEALLRLRQAACHPALIEPKPLPKVKVASPAGAPKVVKPSNIESAKVSMLVEMLEELAVEGHKALVFSQFTSMLALVKTELDLKGITYEELDGTTSAKERALRVDRFQSTPVKDGGRGVFLISLKAGGVGLNLTAAGYVFLLDPWWNPAVEAQAIDRAHRIGQDKSVIAYRLIATGTVEERILELQERKKELVSAIISENAGPLSSMTPEDLEWLLS